MMIEQHWTSFKNNKFWFVLINENRRKNMISRDRTRKIVHTILFIQIDRVCNFHIYHKEEYTRGCLRKAFAHFVHANWSRIHTFASSWKTFIYRLCKFVYVYLRATNFYILKKNTIKNTIRISFMRIDQLNFIFPNEWETRRRIYDRSRLYTKNISRKRSIREKKRKYDANDVANFREISKKPKRTFHWSCFYCRFRDKLPANIEEARIVQHE